MMNDELKQSLLDAIEYKTLAPIQNLTDKTLFTIPLKGISCFMHVAAEEGNLEAIKLALGKYPELLNQKDENNQTPLIWAASRGHIGVVSYLVSRDAELNTKTNNPGQPHHGKTALHWAFDEEHKLVINSLLNAGAKTDDLLLSNPAFHDYLLSLTNDNNIVLLLDLIANNIKILIYPLEGVGRLIHLAAGNNCIQLTKILLKKYPDLLNQSNEINLTPLICAATQGRIHVVRYLMSQGADIEATLNWFGSPHHGKTALHRALDNGHKAVVHCFIMAGAKLNDLLIIDEKFKIYLSELLEANHLAIIHKLAKNKRTLKACYLLHLAAEKACLEPIKIILKMHPDLLNHQDESNQTPLHRAAIAGQKEIVDFLISQNAALNVKNNSQKNKPGRTALHCAVHGEHPAIVVSLITAGTRLDTALLNCKKFRAYLAELIAENNEPIIDIIINRLSLSTPVVDIRCYMHLAAKRGWLELMKMILKKHPDLLNQRDELNQTPLLWAASAGQKAVVDYLISLNADLNQATQCPNQLEHGRTALHWAIEGNHKAVVDCLIKAGASIGESLKNPKFHAYQFPGYALISSLHNTFFKPSPSEKSNGCDWPTFFFPK